MNTIPDRIKQSKVRITIMESKLKLAVNDGKYDEVTMWTNALKIENKLKNELERELKKHRSVNNVLKWQKRLQNTESKNEM